MALRGVFSDLWPIARRHSQNMAIHNCHSNIAWRNSLRLTIRRVTGDGARRLRARSSGTQLRSAVRRTVLRGAPRARLTREAAMVSRPKRVARVDVVNLDIEIVPLVPRQLLIVMELCHQTEQGAKNHVAGQVIVRSLDGAQASALRNSIEALLLAARAAMRTADGGDMSCHQRLASQRSRAKWRGLS